MAKRKKSKTTGPSISSSKSKDKVVVDTSLATVSITATRLREGSFILVLAIASFLSLSLLSYHLSDSAWSTYHSQGSIANAAGVAGAWLSDFSLYFCGYLAFLLPFIICYVGWTYCFRDRRKVRYTRLSTLTRVIGLCFVFGSASGLVNIFLIHPLSPLPFTSGGVIGEVVAHGMVLAFSDQGAVLFLYAILLAGITLFSGLSWLKCAEILGRAGFALSRALWRAVTSIPLGAVFSGAGRIATKAYAAMIASRRNRVIENKSFTSPPIVDSHANSKNNSAALNRATSSFDSDKIEPTGVADLADAATIDSRLAQLKASTINQSSNIDLPAHLKPKPGQGPTLALLDKHELNIGSQMTREEIVAQSSEVEMKLSDFGVQAQVVGVHPGPVVTRYEIALAAGTKASKITALSKDLARSLSVLSVRVVEVIPGKSVIGLELPNMNRSLVSLREVFASDVFAQSRSTLSLALGKDIAGHSVVVDLAKMPHLLVAGTTGSGKSVGLNAMLLSLLYKSTPQQLRIILIDPKMLELAVYEDIPHLLVPVVTDMKEAANALRWCVVEMENRYRLMAALGVRNIAGFNQKVTEAAARGEPLLDPMVEQNPEGPAATLSELPNIVIIADEFADMMMVVGKKVEILIARLAQKARAAGIHLIFATQRPSVDVITGLIKANIPTRISFQVSSRIDSRTIIDQQGAEHLLGHGDMLYLAPGTGIPVRVHGAYVSDEEVHRVVKFLKATGKPDYVTEILENQQAQLVASDPVLASMTGDESADGKDMLFDQVVEFVAQSRRGSISSVQRRFKVGYNRAARIVEDMEAQGMLGPIENGVRQVLLPESRRD